MTLKGSQILRSFQDWNALHDSFPVVSLRSTTEFPVEDNQNFQKELETEFAK